MYYKYEYFEELVEKDTCNLNHFYKILFVFVKKANLIIVK